MDLRRIRERFIRIEKDVAELRDDVGESFEEEKDSVLERLRSLERAASDSLSTQRDETKSVD